MLIWANPFTNLRVPKIFNLRTDPYERADVTSNTYYDWLLDHAFLMVPAQDYVGQFLMTVASLRRAPAANPRLPPAAPAYPVRATRFASCRMY